MIAMQKELVISLEDLDAIVIECGECHSQIRIRMDSELRGGQRSSPLEFCSVCSAKFDSTLRPCVDSFRKALRDLKGDAKVSLQVKTDAIP